MCTAIMLFGCSELLTEAPTAGDTLDGTLPGLSPELNAAFARGDEGFEKVFTVSEGLGPIFNQPSCETCHSGDGRGTPETILIRFSRGADTAEDIGGGQLQDKSITGVSPEILPQGVDVSPRMAPPVFGMGLLEGIPDETLLALEDPDDLDGNGISGRVNRVPSIEKGTTEIGRFGRKANVATLLDQISLAYHQDMGITTDLIPEENRHPQAGNVSLGDNVPDPELPLSTVFDVLVYVRLLSPSDRGQATPEITSGSEIFNEIQCSACHIPSLRTGPNVIPQLNNVDAELYSDLLLHDMGPGLADNRPDHEASGTEWRTAPLWGLRVAGNALGGKVSYLHDGRTSDIAEAVRLHGGEAEAAKNMFLDLSEEDRKSLIAFLLSL
jgi:CxxC motif-containing protein (DUF1111 family)